MPTYHASKACLTCLCLLQVAQLSGYVSEHAAYHHGEQSLQSTIVGLAQKFVGSNNLNLLVPQGTHPPQVASCPCGATGDVLAHGASGSIQKYYWQDTGVHLI